MDKVSLDVGVSVRIVARDLLASLGPDWGWRSAAMGLVSRWVVAVASSLACFVGCWAALAARRVLDAGAQIGIASMLSVVLLAVLAYWAGLAREKRPEADAPSEHASGEVKDSPQGQAIGQVKDGAVVFGPGASLTNPVFNLRGQEGNDNEPLRDGASGHDGVLVVGDVPQKPAAFQPRAELMRSLEQNPEAGYRWCSR